MFAHEQAADSVEHAQQLSKTRFCWIINYLSDYDKFDFLFEPVQWQAHQAHVWPSQHQENGGTYLIPKYNYTEINRKHTAIPRIHSVPIIGIDHGNDNLPAVQQHTRYINDYLGTLRRILSKVTDEYVWVISSVCDYSNFDFTWHPSEWQQEMLHVFPSDEQVFGDTFYVHVPTFLAKTAKLALLEWFDTIHFVEDIIVPRKPMPIVSHAHDSQVDAVWLHDFQDPVVQFVRHTAVSNPPAINLWRTETKAITPLSIGASSVVVPREAKNFLKTQLYDYPTIDRSYAKSVTDAPLDIVFISNGESNAEQNWQHLLTVTKHAANRVIRIDGVVGRAQAYRAALFASDTDWAFCVFAKLKVDDKFDWNWQPDRMRQPASYIFYAKNPCNGLVYGHQALVVYNKRLVLETTEITNLDFTLSHKHDVVPVNSGTAQFNSDPWSTWRTSFRETLKLTHYLSSQPDVETEYRVNAWLEKASGPNANWCLLGAKDAVDYYESVNGEYAKLFLSFDWAWLRDFYNKKYS